MNRLSALIALGILITACQPSLPEITPTAHRPTNTATATNPPSPTPTITLTPTPATRKYNINLFFDKNLSGEKDYEGEIPLEGIVMETRIGEDVFSCTSDGNGDCALQLPIEFYGDSVQIIFPNKVINPQNDHALTTAVINLGQETVQIPEEIKEQFGLTWYSKFGMTAYTRNKIDLFRISMPFLLPSQDVKAIGLSHGEATYWVPGYDLENTCIYNYLDLNPYYITSENYAGDTRTAENYPGETNMRAKRWCASEFGSLGQHNGIDTSYQPLSPRIVVSPALGIVKTVDSDIIGANNAFVMVTKYGNAIQMGHMEGIFAVKEGQIIYPGDVIGIGGSLWGDSKRHIHVAYRPNIPYVLESIPAEPYESFYPKGLVGEDGNQISIDEMKEKYINKTLIFNWGQMTNPLLDFFWYELEWNPPDETELAENERCIFTVNSRGYCIRQFRFTTAHPDFVLHPSDGVFAAGNELVPAEIEPIK